MKRSIAAVALVIPSTCLGQSLFHAPIPNQPLQSQPPAPPGAPAPSPTTPRAPGGEPGPGAPSPTADGALSLAEVSLMVVVPPKPHRYQKHDKVEVIINETSIQKYEQSLDTKKKYDLTDELKAFPSIAKLLEDAMLAEGIGAVKPKIGVSSDGKFKGDGSYERKDRFTARISAIVLDVKPNGQLVVEARETISSDQESKTMVLSGLCDPKDITNANTVQSSQLADLNIKVEHSGQIKDASTKGLIPKIFEALFNF